MFNEGISRAGDLLDLGVQAGIIEKRGSYYLYKEERLAQGRENARQVLNERPDLAQEIEQRIREHFGLAQPETTASDTAQAD